MLRPGDWVEVLPASAILATLDAEGALDGLPFMPEMLPFCGRALRVQVRAERTCARALPPGERRPLRQLDDSVVLEDLRCDGGSHGGCQLGCKIFWKERWLRKIDGPGLSPRAPPEAPVVLGVSRGPDPSVLFCQGTDLGKATRRGHSKWNPQGYVNLLRAGTLTGTELVQMLGQAGLRKVQRTVRSLLPSRPPARAGAAEPLRLQPGEWVEVRSMREILGTLDDRSRTNGLAFSSDMYSFCGMRMRVQSRIHTILAEETGRIRKVRDTVSLVGADCRRYMGCARQMPLLWREVWLKRAAAPGR